VHLAYWMQQVIQIDYIEQRSGRSNCSEGSDDVSERSTCHESQTSAAVPTGDLDLWPFTRSTSIGWTTDLLSHSWRMSSIPTRWCLIGVQSMMTTLRMLHFCRAILCIEKTMLPKNVRQSVCPSVRPSHASIASKRLNASSNFFHRQVVTLF